MEKLTVHQLVLFTDAAIRCAVLGIPFRHHGRWECEGLRGHRTGLDCAGLGLHCAIKAGVATVNLADQKVYARAATADSLRSMVKANCGEPVLGGPAHGRVGLFAQHETPGHVGIFVMMNGVLNLVHADNTHGKVVMHNFTGTYERMLVEVYQP